MHNMSQACSDDGNVVRQQLVSVGKPRGCTLMVRGPCHGSLSGVLCGCATLPILTSVWESTTSASFQFISCICLTACSATPDWAVFP